MVSLYNIREKLEEIFMECQIIQIDKSQIDKIKALWEKLNKLHLKNSNYFKEHYSAFSFDKRCEKFMEIDEECIKIDIVQMATKVVGYCVSTIENRVGEIDSIFVEEKYQIQIYHILDANTFENHLETEYRLMVILIHFLQL